MLELKNSSCGSALLQVVTLAVPLLAGCELRLPGDGSDHYRSFDEDYREDTSGLRSEDTLAGGSALPESLRAGTAEMPAADFSWRVPGISERLRGAFSGATCNGCHAGDTKTERFQHIAPGASRSAPARLSRFLYDDDAPTDELRRRELLLVELSATACPDDPPSTRGDY